MIFNIDSSKDFSSKQAIFTGDYIVIGVDDKKEQTYEIKDLASAEIVTEKPHINKLLGMIVGVSVFCVCFFLFNLFIAIIVPIGIGFLWGNFTESKDIVLQLKFNDNKGFRTDIIRTNHEVESLIQTAKKNTHEKKKSLLKKCPYCAETIKMEAILCKHCGKELEG